MLYLSSLFAHATVLGSAFASSAVTTNVARTRCSTSKSKEQLVVAEAHFANARTASNSTGRRAARINVHWHVVSNDSTPSGGNIPDFQIASSLRVLNQDFSGSGLSFTLASTDRTVNTDWFYNAGPYTSQQTAMKNQLRLGGVADLNVYTVGFASADLDGLLGYSTFPFDYAGAPKDDGSVILFSSVPGGTTTGFNEGKSLTHEVGHWVGLYHTFEGGCSDSGDSGDQASYDNPPTVIWDPLTNKFQVSDTPAEATPASGCSIGRDTCTSPGVDPIHNYMDYSDDACMTEFTAGQITRFKSQMSTYRSVYL